MKSPSYRYVGNPQLIAHLDKDFVNKEFVVGSPHQPI